MFCILLANLRKWIKTPYNLLSVNDDFEGKRNTENLCKRVKCKVYFAILQLVMPNFGYQIYFIDASIYVKVLNITQILDACLS